MSMNNTPAGERVHIGFFGRRNAGKSSLLNAVTGQELAVVSEIRGTTTDPVYKAMELLPLGPAMLIDTPGFDDEGTLGEQRVKKAKQVLDKTDIAVLAVDAAEGMTACDEELVSLFKERDIPFMIACTKVDMTGGCQKKPGAEQGRADMGSVSRAENPDENKIASVIYVSAVTGVGIRELKERLAAMLPDKGERRLVADLIKPLDVVMLVVPIDAAAPKGRLILPQQQAIRDLLEAGAIPMTVRETELKDALTKLSEKPALVITDSQAFEEVAAIVPEDIPLTSFSILMARYKGFLKIAVDGVRAIDGLKDGDRVLIAEGCTHHRQCDDIGTVKIPRFLKKYTGKDLIIETASGTGFPEDLAPYALVIHCGGCMLNEREVLRRMRFAKTQGVPVTNYGISIAQMKGILERSIACIHLTEE
ncbi:MAG: [FeFe] hydrogenase H-cluster maturation GTPase HydF [Lachnospiraceae bacterium]|jgi:[FeFe] hydrogenase H-cluster maturation GTPase HydF|nr:[FeFe] hydrogenase H-cluster maturation GTPase HydF [Lachnospiraceae bacterium]